MCCRDLCQYQGLKDAGVAIPMPSLFNSPIWPVLKIDRSWSVTVDFVSLNQAVTSYSCSTHYGFIAWTNQHVPWHQMWHYWFGKCFFSMPVSKDHRKLPIRNRMLCDPPSQEGNMHSSTPPTDRRGIYGLNLLSLIYVSKDVLDSLVSWFVVTWFLWFRISSYW